MLDVGIEVELRAHGGAQPVLIGQRAKLRGRLSVSLPWGKTMGQAIYFSEKGKTMGQAIYFSESKLWGKLPVTGYLCFTSPLSHSARRCRA